MRSLFAWLMFAGVPPVEMRQAGENGGGDGETVMRIPLPGIPRTVGSVLVFSMALLGAAHVWTGKVEPWFGRVTKMAEERMAGRESGNGKGADGGGVGNGKAVLPIRRE